MTNDYHMIKLCKLRTYVDNKFNLFVFNIVTV